MFGTAMFADGNGYLGSMKKSRSNARSEVAAVGNGMPGTEMVAGRSEKEKLRALEKVLRHGGIYVDLDALKVLKRPMTFGRAKSAAIHSPGTK